MHLIKRSEPAIWFGSKESACKLGPHGMERIMEREAAREMHACCTGQQIERIITYTQQHTADS
jgi:hypothetical protein